MFYKSYTLSPSASLRLCVENHTRNFNFPIAVLTGRSVTRHSLLSYFQTNFFITGIRFSTTAATNENNHATIHSPSTIQAT